MDSSLSTSQAIDDSNVHLGAWTDWSYGPTRGATLTLTRRDGALLTAFVALFITFVGTCFWRIACFAIHLVLSSQVPEDGLYHQRQAVLRNAANGTSGLWKLICIVWTWRRHAERLYPRILPLLLFAILSVATFGVAGIFSSRVSSASGNDVLIASANCGIPNNVQGMDTTSAWTLVYPYVVQRIATASNYAQQCYLRESTPEECPNYVKTNLPYSADNDHGCPFQGLCLNNSTSIYLDSGYINSHDDLGINSPPEERFLYRMVTHCATLNSSGHSRFDEETKTVSYYYGQDLVHATNVTYEYSSVRSPIDQFANSTAYQDYTLSASISWESQPQYSHFSPIPELNRTEADVTLLFLSANGVVYSQAVDDPWYAAHDHVFTLHEGKGSVDGQLPVYQADQPVSVLACAEQYQWCNAERHHQRKSSDDGDGCGPLSGYFTSSSLNPAEQLWETESQRRAFNWSVAAMASGLFNSLDVAQSLRASSLLSRFSLGQGIQGALPADQWQREMNNWFAMRLAGAQQSVVDVASGPRDPGLLEIMARPEDGEGRELCRNQKIRNTRFTSFNTLGLSVIFGVGGAIILLSYTIEPIVQFVQRRKNLDVFARLEWVTNDTLHLQRLAHEELGCGHWERGVEDIPRTALKGERLALLDVSDLDHPRLKRPSAVSSEEETLASDVGGRDGNKGNHTASQTQVQESVNGAHASSEAGGSDSVSFGQEVGTVRRSHSESGSDDGRVRQAPEAEGLSSPVSVVLELGTNEREENSDHDREVVQSQETAPGLGRRE